MTTPPSPQKKVNWGQQLTLHLDSHVCQMSDSQRGEELGMRGRRRHRYMLSSREVPVLPSASWLFLISLHLPVLLDGRLARFQFTPF